MEFEDFKKKKSAIIEKYGNWVSYELNYDDGRFLMAEAKFDKEHVFSRIFPRTILRAVADFTISKSWEELEVLDLGCFEGQIGIEFAMQNVKKVVGIEGREGNVVKANFAKGTLGLKKLTIFHDNVMNLSKEKYGSFDVVLCLGILYHLPVSGIFNFLERVYEMTNGVAIIDTQVAIIDKIQIKYKNRQYYGFWSDESLYDNSPQSSMTGENSFWLTKPSLFNLIRDVGFASLYVIPYPGETWRGVDDRITVVAVKNIRNKKNSLPLYLDKEDDDFFAERKYPSTFIVHKINALELQNVKTKT